MENNMEKCYKEQDSRDIIRLKRLEKYSKDIEKALQELEEYSSEINSVLTDYNRKSCEETMMVKGLRKSCQETTNRKTHQENLANIATRIAKGINSHNGEKSESEYRADTSKTQDDFERENLYCHTKKGFDRTIVPATPEAALMRLCDKISYIPYDMVDGLREGFITELNEEYKVVLRELTPIHQILPTQLKLWKKLLDKALWMNKKEQEKLFKNMNQ